MFRLRICLIIILVAGATSNATAVDYTVPAGVTVLTEEQLLNQIIGNTLIGGYENWIEYYEPPTGDQKKGRFKAKSAAFGRHGGSWEVKGHLMCWQFDKSNIGSKCFTTVLDGDIVTWYKTNGFPWYSRHGQIKLISGNPKNL